MPPYFAAIANQALSACVNSALVSAETYFDGRPASLVVALGS